MAAEYKTKYSAVNVANITLSGLAASTSQVGRQSAFIDNSTTNYSSLLVYAGMTISGTISGSKAGYIYGLRGDGAGHRTDGAGTGDAALTFLNAPLIGVMGNKATPATGDSVYGEFIFDQPGPTFAFGAYQDMASTLTINTGANYIKWVGITYQS